MLQVLVWEKHYPSSIPQDKNQILNQWDERHGGYDLSKTWEKKFSIPMWKAKEQQHLPTLWNSHSTHSLIPPSSYHVWGPLSPIKDPEIIRERQIYDIANMQNQKKKEKEKEMNLFPKQRLRNIENKQPTVTKRKGEWGEG